MTTIIPKHIASATVSDDKLYYRYRFLILAGMLILSAILIYYAFYSKYFLALFLLGFLWIYYEPKFDRRILDFCEDVIDTGDGLMVQKDNIKDKIDYNNIADVCYKKPTYFIPAAFVAISLKNPSQIGKIFYFYGWKKTRQDKTMNYWRGSIA